MKDFFGAKFLNWIHVILKLRSHGSFTTLGISPSFDHLLIHFLFLNTPPLHPVRHHPPLSPFLCVRSFLPCIHFRELFISLERWMRGWGHLWELINPPLLPQNTQTPTRKQGYRLVGRCRCATKPVRTHTANQRCSRCAPVDAYPGNENGVKAALDQRRRTRPNCSKNLLDTLHVNRHGKVRYLKEKVEFRERE